MAWRATDWHSKVRHILLQVFQTSSTVSFKLLTWPPSLAVPCRVPVLAHPLHPARPTRDHLDCPAEVWLRRWPGAHAGVPVSHVRSSTGPRANREKKKKSPTWHLTSVLVPCCRIKIPPDCTTELNHNAYHFLQSVFDKHDKVSFQKKKTPFWETGGSINIRTLTQFSSFWPLNTNKMYFIFYLLYNELDVALKCRWAMTWSKLWKQVKSF